MTSGTRFGEYFGKYFERYIAAADHCNRLPIGRQFVAVEEQGSRSHGAAGLGNEPCSRDDGAHGGANLGFSHCDNTVDEGLDVVKIAHAYALGTQAVGDGTAGELGRPLDNVARTEALGSVSGELMLHAEDGSYW